MPEFMTTQETAQKWNITERSLQTLCDKGRVSGAKKMNGIWLIPKSEIEFMYSKNRLRKSTDCKKKLKMLSLFSGCGGMDLGFEGDFEVLKEDQWRMGDLSY